MMAITHHLIVRLAAHKCGYIKFKDYIILGDDVVIANEKVAWAYKDIITRLGVDISISKTITPTGGNFRCEFASKLVCNGTNISPLPVGLLIQNNIQRLISLCKSVLFSISHHKVDTPLANLLLVMAPKAVKPLSGSFKIRSYGFGEDINLAIDTFLVVLGSSFGLDIFTHIQTKRGGTRSEVNSQQTLTSMLRP